MKITVPIRITLDVATPDDALVIVIQHMRYMRLFRNDMTYNMGKPIVGEFDPSKDKNLYKPKG